MSVIVWADIPVTDMDRARKFYGDILQVEMQLMPGAGDSVAIPAPGSETGPVAFDLAKGDNQKPSMDGATVYLDAGGDIQGMVRRVEAAGGKVLQQPQDMGEMVGWIAFFVDSEGNRVGIQQPSKPGM